MSRRGRRLTMGLVCAFLAACAAGGPVDIDTKADSCSRCRMGIEHLGHAAELFTGNGELRKYDSLGCLVADVKELRAAGREVRAVWVVDYRTHAWVRADAAHYALAHLQTDHMGYGVAALASREQALELVRGAVTGVVRWDDLLAGANEVRRP